MCDNCSICFDEIGNKNLVITDCNHKFHAKCYSSFILKSGINSICPLCRNDNLFSLKPEKRTKEKFELWESKYFIIKMDFNFKIRVYNLDSNILSSCIKTYEDFHQTFGFGKTIILNKFSEILYGSGGEKSDTEISGIYRTLYREPEDSYYYIKSLSVVCNTFQNNRKLLIKLMEIKGRKQGLLSDAKFIKTANFTHKESCDYYDRGYYGCMYMNKKLNVCLNPACNPEDVDTPLDLRCKKCYSKGSGLISKFLIYNEFGEITVKT